MTDGSRRSGGVTAAAVVALVGSAGALLFGSMMAVVGVMVSQDPSVAAAAGDSSAAPTLAVFLIMGGSQLLVSIWGIVSAVGLLNLKNWARLSFVVFGALLAASSAFVVLGSLVAAPMLAIAPPEPDVPQGVLVAVIAMTALVAATGLALGIWWLIYFNRASVRVQFTGVRPAVPDSATRAPVRIVVIAWLLIASGLFLPLQLVNSYPLVLFGVVIQGWPGRALVIAQQMVALTAGIGLLRKRVGAHTLAVGLYAFGLLNLVATVIVPSGPARVRQAIEEMAGEQGLPDALADWSIWIGTIGGACGSLLFLWLLMSRRQAFIRACAPASPAPGPAVIASGDSP